MDIASRFRKFRNSTDMSVAKLASEIDIKDYKVRDCEAGKQRFDDEILEALARRFKNLNINWLLTGCGDMLLSTPTLKCTEKILLNSIRFKLIEKKEQNIIGRFQYEIILMYRCFNELIEKSQENNVFTDDMLIASIKNYKISLLKDIFQNLITEKTKKTTIAFILELEDEEVNFICNNLAIFISVLWEARAWFHKGFLTIDAPPSN